MVQTLNLFIINVLGVVAMLINAKVKIANFIACTIPDGSKHKGIGRYRPRSPSSN
jgi:hypothetical protein